MNLHLENVNLQSTSGPNHFAAKLIKYMPSTGATCDPRTPPTVRLCFIESHDHSKTIPLFQRLDGIYFNLAQPYKVQNANIQRTYEAANGVIFQSAFNKELTTKYFGDHPNDTVIHNGADTEYIETVPPLEASQLERFEKVWACASSWRPHKRLAQNIQYFLEHSSEKDCLVIAGSKEEKIFKNDRIFYVGNVGIPYLTALYKRADYFIHMAWLDHCPNVVVDARAADCHIICSSAGGTREIAGPDATVIEEDEWDFEPVYLYEPPSLDFSRKIKNPYNVSYNMDTVCHAYHNFISKTI